MEEKKKKINYFKIIMILLFVVFIGLYIFQKNGYYEYMQYNKMMITKESMEKFESDVAEGKDVTISNYIDNTYKDYSNNVSNLGLKTSSFIESLMTDGLGKTFEVLKTLFAN